MFEQYPSGKSSTAVQEVTHILGSSLCSVTQVLSGHIKQAAMDMGFQAVGIARVLPPEPTQSSLSAQSRSLTSLLRDRLTEWLSRGYHGTMSWLARDPTRRSHPRLVLPECRSIICVGVNYFTDHEADEGQGHGKIARYAWGEDYHKVLDQRLKQLEQYIHEMRPEAKTKRYVDTGPVMEKAWAQEAGLGWIGKHSNLVSPHFGSWLLLGEILTTLPLEPDEPGTDLCGTCRLCIAACPTQAIPEPYVVDATQCISYLTIEFRGKEEEIPPELQKQTGNHIFGCDECLDACPYNVNAVPSRDPAFQPRQISLAPNLEALSSMTQEEFTQTFMRSPIRRAKETGLKRNVAIVLKNNQAAR